VAWAASGVKAPRPNSTTTMGWARAMSPAVAGRQMNSVRLMEAESVCLNSGIWPLAERRARLGKATVPMAAPNTPSGNCTSRSA